LHLWTRQQILLAYSFSRYSLLCCRSCYCQKEWYIYQDSPLLPQRCNDSVVNSGRCSVKNPFTICSTTRLILRGIVILKLLPTFPNFTLGRIIQYGEHVSIFTTLASTREMTNHTYIAVATSSSLTIRNPKIQIHTLILNKPTWQKFTHNIHSRWIGYPFSWPQNGTLDFRRGST
jgi:hypothetical protein